MKSLRGIPTSRAYWELRAEQMMNRIFDPAPPIDLEPGPTLPPAAGTEPPAPASSTPAATSAPAATTPAAATERRDRQLLLLTLLGGVCMVSAASSVLYLGHWNRMQESVRQERNLLMLERLRDLGPATPTPATTATAKAPTPTPLPASVQAPTAVLPPGETLPPPPEEPWMEHLDTLPPSPPSGSPVLTVPVSPRLAAPAPPATAPTSSLQAAAGPTPELLGVVAAPGKAGSAIFKLGGQSTNVGVGDTIGSSGWRLRSAQGDTVLIERSGQVRRLSVGNGF